jgi:hypothetical protein
MILRVTNLEKFRRFRDGVSSFDTEQSVIDTLTGVFVGNNKTIIGSAFHSIIEHSEDIRMFKSDMSGHVIFNEEQIKIAVLHSLNLQPFIPEIRQNKDYETNYGIVTMSGAIDVLQGNQIRDTKVKFSSPLYLDYYDSFQWRIYLSIFGLDRFYYDIFELIGYKDEMMFDVSKCVIKQHEPYECLRYENLETDIIELLNEFLEWVKFRNIKL